MFKAIIKRKFKYDFKDFATQNIIIKVKEIMEASLKRKPRPEERYKFIFKKVFKKMREDFKVTLKNKKLRKEEIDKLFYEHYFLKISEEKGIDLKNFVSPTNTSAKTIYKTINNQYI